MGAIDKSRKNLAKKWAKDAPTPFKKIDLINRSGPAWMTRAYENNRYIVMICDNCPTTHGNAIRAMVQKIDDTKIVNHWSEMQKIKNQIFGNQTTAIEYYPSVDSLIDDHNIYWMWIFPEGVLPLPIN